jgi:hypothetical protein
MARTLVIIQAVERLLAAQLDGKRRAMKLALMLVWMIMMVAHVQKVLRIRLELLKLVIGLILVAQVVVHWLRLMRCVRIIVIHAVQVELHPAITALLLEQPKEQHVITVRAAVLALHAIWIHAS